MASVQYSPFTAIFNNMASGNVIVGSPGSGKTFFMLNVCANALMMEQRVFAVDPKNDLGVLADVFPDKVEYVNINNIKPGALNPFQVLKNVDTNVISSIVSIICGGLTDKQTVSVTPIVKDFVVKQKKSGRYVSFADLADYLYANDNLDAQAVGTKLHIHRDSKYGALLFDRDDSVSNTGMQMDERSKIISFHGMELPKGVDKLTEEQRFNSAVVYIVCKMLRELLSEGGYPTLFVMDEAHIAFQNPSFSSVIDEFLVLGRSLNVPTLLASQSVKHYPPTIAQLVSTKFCFKSSTQDATEFLQMFHSGDGVGDVDREGVVNQIAQFKTGQCLMLDAYGRAGAFKVTSLLGADVTSNPLMKKSTRGA